MFTVDRQQNGTMLAYRVHEKLAGHDQHFLVGQKNFLAGLRRSQGRFQACRANDGCHHRIDIGMGSHGDQRLDTMTHRGRQTGVPAKQSQFIGQRRVAHDGEFRLELPALLEQLVDLAMCAQRKSPVTVGMATNHIERIDADRTCSAKNRYVLALHPAPAA